LALPFLSACPDGSAEGDAGAPIIDGGMSDEGSGNEDPEAVEPCQGTNYSVDLNSNCDVQIPSPGEDEEPFDPSMANAILVCVDMPYELTQVSAEPQCGDPNGWYYDNSADPERIILCPNTCSMLACSDQTTIIVVLGCPTKTGE
jgi:hypothetical protein